MRRRVDQNNFKSSGYLWPLLIVIVLVMALIGGVTVYHHYQMSQLRRYPFRGISVTQQDGYVDFFSLAKTGQRFVYIRATQGAIYTDNNFDNNYQRAEGSGLDLGVYHVFSFASSPQAQFKNFRNQVATSVGSLPIAVRVSSSRALSNAKLKAVRTFIRELKTYYRQSVIVWTSRPVANQLKLGRDWLNNSFDYRNQLSVLNPQQTLNLNGQEDTVTQMVFSGNRQTWHRFVNAD